MTTPRPIPADLADHINDSLSSLHKRYGANNSMLYRWFSSLEKQGIIRVPEGKGGAQPIYCPDDFVTVQEGKPVAWLVQHYNVSRSTINRWSRSKGIKPRRATPPMEKKPPKIFKPAGMSISAGGTIAPHRPHRENSPAGEAAAYLQPDYIPVFRCDEDGRQDIAGKFWRCGNRVAITDDAIIALAERNKEMKARRMAA